MSSLALIVFASTAYALAPNLTWTGQSTGNESWSSRANWSGSHHPSANETLGTLNFGGLIRACTEPTTLACYLSDNDLPNLSVHGIDITDNVGYYSITGDPITLGAGGITASPALMPASGSRVAFRAGRRDLRRAFGSSTPRHEPGDRAQTRTDPFLNGRYASDNYSFFGPSSLALPLVLSAPQTWTITAPKSPTPDYPFAGLDLSTVTGDQPLALDFDGNPLLEIDGDTEIGAIVASGDGQIIAGTGLNATTGSSVTVGNQTGLAFVTRDSDSGPLEIHRGGYLQVGESVPETNLSVNGTLTLNPGATLEQQISEPASASPLSASQLNVAGNVQIGGAKLALYQGNDADFFAGCVDLHAGDVYTLLSTTGTLTGTFANAPAGTVIKVKNDCDYANADATAVVGYTADSVLATVKSAGDAGTVPTGKSQPRLLGTAQVGRTLKATHGTWTHDPTSYRYVWYSCDRSGNCKKIPHAGGTKYRLRPADVSKFIVVNVTGVNRSGRGYANEAERGPVKAASKRKKAKGRAL